jgi:hypothetical protein
MISLIGLILAGKKCEHLAYIYGIKTAYIRARARVCVYIYIYIYLNMKFAQSPVIIY